ncbi:hypothetical protein HL033_04320 [Neoehrlichia mikurensis]|uniref:Uncharacterized protein n=1 Tax=Neoehrlichia mikurensis TaxID=89586 RepID=A0A9Q9F3Y4_9RICK|nr:hypothetical protein [Neoehrlichia mikurensis]QXK91939.1 hypothetical protein IAH97_04315 [Neoehrlichia mikurensis]QXK93152.1 hypothetical protein HUN61_04310 [Neoehrlichia mikurensis]QXK93632.1 hypothetical protein HL033_04320 [Neoehrlichia mikurensis]UTO55413.1 hypothetical protein LUA82_04540 [Neoehrlichia mikurensis]UTO56332.1 hypothetical protein LUA81_04490 [Neoehrlichia mikurensis]
MFNDLKNNTFTYDNKSEDFINSIDELINIKKLEFENFLENSISHFSNYFQHVLIKELAMLLQMELLKFQNTVSSSNVKIFDNINQEIINKILFAVSRRAFDNS